MEVSRKKTRAPKASNTQMEYLITYMSNHIAFATGKLLGARGKAAHDTQWQQLTEQLNSMVGPLKPVDGWKKVFTHMIFSLYLKYYFFILVISYYTF